jgi:PKD repeat protein
MIHQSSLYRITAIAVIIFLISAGVLTLLTYPGDEQSNGSGAVSAGISSALNNTRTSGVDQADPKTSKIRVLWYDDAGRTYTFRDYDNEGILDDESWTRANLPSPEPDASEKTAAMVRFIEWDGEMERMTGTKYLLDQDVITNILNTYTLIAPPPEKPELKDTPALTSPTPQSTPAPGMLIPTMRKPCNPVDGTIRVTFGYISRHDLPVTLPIGEQNGFTPGNPDRGQPRVFTPGVHPDVFSVSFPSNSTNIVWNLMNTAVGAGEVPQLKAGLLVEPQGGYAPLDVRLIDKSVGNTPDNPLTGTWDLGNGIPVEGDKLTYRFELPGEYQIKRTVGSACGSDTAVQTVPVYQVMFAMEPVPGTERTFQFNDQSTGGPKAWFWNFNDGFTSWEQNPVHTWASPGTYNVELSVSGRNGSGSTVRRIEVG